jgi:hypothetical protein
LREVLHELADGGNSVVVVERNLEVIKTADWLWTWATRAATAADAWWWPARRKMSPR